MSAKLQTPVLLDKQSKTFQMLPEVGFSVSGAHKVTVSSGYSKQNKASVDGCITADAMSEGQESLEF